MGMRYGKVLIREENRQSTWETKPEDVRILQGIRDGFLKKGIEAVLFAKDAPSSQRTKYAVFVEDGFLKDTTMDGEEW